VPSPVTGVNARNPRGRSFAALSAMRGLFPITCTVLLLPLGAAGQTTVENRPAPDSLTANEHYRPREYKPLHKGGIDLATGLYVRENEDLVVPGTPALVLRRTYLSGNHAAKQFGVGALHNGEEYLIGDGQTFQWVSLILARGTRIEFTRTSPGPLLPNAEFVHTATASDWHGSTIIWTGLTWVLQKKEGSTMTFKACSSQARSVCSIIQSRDPQGRTIYYRRHLASGDLLKIDDGAGRWISLEYDDSHRITRAYASNGRWVRYAYDERGRLASASTSSEQEYRYSYSDLDELATIEEPGTSIENTYADGRCIRQVNKYPDGEPLIFEFSYQLEGGRVVRTDSRRSDGTFRSYAWDDSKRVKTEAFGQEGNDPIVFDYDRDTITKAVRALTVTCPDVGSGTTRRTANVTSGKEDVVKADLIAQCFASAIRR
jgi:hypothetical protein